MLNLNSKERKLNICILAFVILSIMVTGYIFYNSFQNPDESNKKSNAISNKIQSIVDPEKKISDANFKKVTRKAAHIIEFAALGISLGSVFLCVYKKNKKIFISLPLLLALSVAVTDEFIQSFNKRTSCLKDVLIDFAGSSVGLLVICIFAILHYNKYKRLSGKFKEK